MSDIRAPDRRINITKTDATEHKTNGRRTANDVLITSFRAGVLAVLVLAGTAAA